MPRVLGQQPGGFDVEFDDGTTSFVPDFLANGLVGQGLGLDTTAQQPPLPQPVPQLPPEQPQAQPTTVTQPTPQLPPGVTRFAGTGPYQERPVERKNTGIPQAVSAAQVLAPQAAAADERKQALAAQGNIAADQTQAAQPFLDRETAERTSRATAITRAHEEAAAELSDYEANINQRLAEIPTKDPQRLWNDTSNFGKAALMFGAFAAGFAGGTGGINSFWNTMNKLIDNDLNAQQSNIDTAKEKVFRAERAAERGRESIQDRLRGQHEAYLERLGSIKAGMTAEMAKYEAPKIRAQFEEGIAKVDQEMAHHYKEAVQLQFNTSLQSAQERSQQYHARQMEALGWSRERREAAEFELAKDEAAAKRIERQGNNVLLNRETGEKWIIGTQAADKEEMVKNFANDKHGISGYAQLTGELKRYHALANKLGRTYAGPLAKSSAVVSDRQQLRAEMKGLREQIVQKYRHDLFGAAVTGKEETNFLSAMPEPDSITGPEGANVIKSFIEVKAREAQRKYVNGLDLRHEDGTKVDLGKEWGTIEAVDDPKFMDAPELLDSGSATAAGLSSLPRGPKGKVDSKVAGDQVKLLTSRANELVKRAENFASRSNMTPEVGAQAVDQLKQWSAMLNSTGYVQEGEKVFNQALKLEDMLAKDPKMPVDQLPLPGGPTFAPMGRATNMQ